MTAHEHMIIHLALKQKREEKKQQQEYQRMIDRNATGWIGFNKAYLKAQKRYYK